MESILSANPALNPEHSRTRLYVVIAVRALFLSALTFALNQIVDLGTSPTLLSLGVILGTILSSRLSFGRLTSIGFFLGAASSVALYRALWWLIDLLPAKLWGSVLTLASLELHVNLVAIAAFVAALTTWMFWRSAHALTLELLALAYAAIYLMSGHRNLQLDQPAFVSSIAWSLGWSPLTTLAIAGLSVVTALVGFVLLTSPPGRPVAGAPSTQRTSPQIVYRDSFWSMAGLVTGIVIAGLLYLIAQITFLVFSQMASGSITSMGVGQETKEELSPLGFHSSLGKNAQPAALVRLEGDYAQNPFTPMLYFRESALSKFSGREMVLADARFDQDVNRSRPDEIYSAEPDLELLSRTPLVQSIFLLAEHKTAFAIDYPLEIRQLQNPNPSRFKASYKAYSVAPGFSLKDLAGQAVGDARWDEATRAHYLETNQDPRYLELANKIVGDVQDPVARAFLVTQWFSEHAIYTLTPGHEVPPNADPVEPFLFGDMRGYCVHFAHAMVYLFRSLGIPARIGTGYLTDLSQARDGHILLRMNDRHAWSEVFIADRGWIPFDPQPQQVENHGESPVDMKLLEELMGMLGPSEEILPKDVAKDEAGLQEPAGFPIPDWRYVASPLLLFVALLACIKVLLSVAWRFAAHPARRVALRYRAEEASLYDLGFPRFTGETREEYRSRLTQQFGSDPLTLTPQLNSLRYGDEHAAVIKDPTRHQDWKSNFSWWKRTLGVLNPSSAIAILMRKPW